MLVYIIKLTICLVLLLVFYHLVLEKEKMHRFNRFYLLGAIVFSFFVPSFIITVAPREFVEPILNQKENLKQVSIQSSIDYTNYLIAIYSIISFALISILSKKIYQILEQTKRNQKINYFSATVVLLKEKIVPYTFLHYIFVNKKTYQSNTVKEQILTHELAHVQQKHSLDVLFIEVLQNLFWFNPIFRYYKKAIQLNHEFLADDAVLKSHQNITEYQYVLLNTIAQNNNIYLASNLNYSLTKKRLLMMTTPSSKTKILLKKLLVLPLTAGFIFAFAQRVEAQEKKKELIKVVEVKFDEKGISKKEMNNYKQLFNKGKKSKIYKQKDVEKMLSLHKRMSKKQQNSVTDIRKVIPPQPKLIKVNVKEIEGTLEEIEIEEVVKSELKEVKEVEELEVEELEVIEVKELKEVKETPEEIEVEEVVELELKEVKISEISDLKEYKKKHGVVKMIPPPPPLKKNATKKEIKRYNKAYKIWKEKTKNIPPPPKKQ